jgi:hypothetical protein
VAICSNCGAQFNRAPASVSREMNVLPAGTIEAGNGRVGIGWHAIVDLVKQMKLQKITKSKFKRQFGTCAWSETRARSNLFEQITNYSFVKMDELRFSYFCAARL